MTAGCPALPVHLAIYHWRCALRKGSIAVEGQRGVGGGCCAHIVLGLAALAVC